ncbi:hypothetical protein FISHEDRAFT_6059, partial [Fistulina hepatica ATCC 64428]
PPPHNPPPPPARPSTVPHHWSRETLQQETLTDAAPSAVLCPSGLSACPVAPHSSLSALPATLADWKSLDYECVDLSADLYACGGCPALDSIYDCTIIPHALTFSCVAGTCIVDSCQFGF